MIDAKDEKDYEAFLVKFLGVKVEIEDVTKDLGTDDKRMMLAAMAAVTAERAVSQDYSEFDWVHLCMSAWHGATKEHERKKREH